MIVPISESSGGGVASFSSELQSFMLLGIGVPSLYVFTFGLVEGAVSSSSFGVGVGSFSGVTVCSVESGTVYSGLGWAESEGLGGPSSFEWADACSGETVSESGPCSNSLLVEPADIAREIMISLIIII